VSVIVLRGLRIEFSTPPRVSWTAWPERQAVTCRCVCEVPGGRGLDGSEGRHNHGRLHVAAVTLSQAVAIV